MNARLVLHGALFFYAMLIMQTVSILPFILPVALVIMLGACRNRNANFDTIDMFWLLFQLSFVVAPAAAFREADGDRLFSSGVIVDYWMGRVNIYPQYQLILLFLTLFLVAFINTLLLPAGQKVTNLTRTSIRLSLPTLFGISLLAFLVTILLQGGLGNVLASRYDKARDAMSIYSSLSSTLFMAAFWLATVRLQGSSPRKRLGGIVLLLCMGLILYNPFNTARFVLIQVWLPFILIQWPGLLRFPVFAGTIAFGIMVLMPLLSFTTRFGADADFSRLSIDANSFLAFFDQHSVSLHLIDMAERGGYQFGSSTLSVIAFFVPRALWPGKPQTIGLEIGDELAASSFTGTNNLSGPLFLDFYYDLGLPGVIIGTILAALIFRYLLRAGGRVNNVPLVEYIILAALPIVFRGSVGSVIGVVFFSLIFYYLLVYWLARMTWKTP